MSEMMISISLMKVFTQWRQPARGDAHWSFLAVDIPILNDVSGRQLLLTDMDWSPTGHSEDDLERFRPLVQIVTELGRITCAEACTKMVQMYGNKCFQPSHLGKWKKYYRTAARSGHIELDSTSSSNPVLFLPTEGVRSQSQSDLEKRKKRNRILDLVL
jgi:hypothetical protein